MDIIKVREINRILDITPVPHAPEYIRGLVNLRGQTVTVFDLGIRLGLDAREVRKSSHNIILKEGSVGLLVDGIGDVIEAREAQMERPPANLQGIGVEFIDSVVKLRDELLVILSSESILEQ
jgi:purine-binding chemotaxis protein CheW